MLANVAGRGGPIIWPLRERMFHPVFLQQRPKWTGGLRVPSIPVLPWDDMDRPPVIGFGLVDRAPIAASTLPINFALSALGLRPRLLTELNPTYLAEFSEQRFEPAVVHPLRPLPATFLTISGQTKDSTGTALGGCTVDLFVTATDFRVETTLSNGDGYYYFKGAAMSVTHYAVAYKAGSPDVAGTTVNTLVGA